MKLKNNKGFSGVDVSVSLIIIIIFVSVIVTLLYNFSLVSKKVERQGEASYIIIQILEKLKQENFDNVTDNINVDEIIGKHDGYNIEVKVKNYEDDLSNTNNQEETLIKLVTVKVEYKVGKNSEKIEISTILVNTDE